MRPTIVPTASLLALALTAAEARAQNPLELLLQQQTHYWATVPATVSATDYLEGADDFDLVADLHRVRILGKSCFNCAPGDLLSVRLRFYEWTPSGPGAVQYDLTLTDGDPGLAHSEGPGLIDVSLPAPFAATGKHFLSAQVEVDGVWTWWFSNYSQPSGSALWVRDGADAAWTPFDIVYPAGPADADLAFELYGVDDTPPTGGTDPCGPWEVVATPSPTDGYGVFLQGVKAFDSDDVWAVGRYQALTSPPWGYDSHTWIQHFDGAAWQQVPSPNPEPYPGGGYLSLEAVDGVAPDDLWAAGSFRTVAPDGFLGGQLFVLHFDGATWSQVEAPMTSGGTGARVLGIEALAPDDVWFFGEWLKPQLGVGQQHALAMHWDGSSFTVVDTPFFDNSGGYGGGHSTWAADALAPDDIWAVGAAGDGDFTPHSYIIHWDGSSWTHVPGPTPGIDQALWAVAAVAPDDVWASGFYTELDGSRKSLFVHWDGASWTQVDAPGGGATLAVRGGPDDIVSTAGIYGGEGIFRWDGTSWAEVAELATTTNPSLMGLDVVDGCELWAVGRQNGPDVGGLTVHLAPVTGAAATDVLEPCLTAVPAESLLSSPPPALGTHVSFAVDDPSGASSVAPGSPALLAVGLPSQSGVCGVAVDGFGPNLAAGELFVDPNLSLIALASWAGPGAPAVFDLAVPDESALVGLGLRAQAALVDGLDGDVVLTRALALTFGQ